MGITKTDYTRGMQCPKMLWLDKHKPEKRIISQEMQAILDGGNEFGDKTMAMFGDYVETTTLKANGYWYGGFPKDGVINFVQLRDGNADEVIKNATWFELNQVELANK